VEWGEKDNAGNPACPPSVVKAEGFWTLLKQSIFENSPFKAKVLIIIFYA